MTEYQDDDTRSDLTGSSFLVQLRQDADSTSATATFTTTILDAVQGEWQFSLTPTQTTAISEGLYFYDVQRTYPDGTVHTRFQGEALVEDDISHA